MIQVVHYIDCLLVAPSVLRITQFIWIFIWILNKDCWKNQIFCKNSYKGIILWKPSKLFVSVTVFFPKISSTCRFSYAVSPFYSIPSPLSSIHRYAFHCESLLRQSLHTPVPNQLSLLHFLYYCWSNTHSSFNFFITEPNRPKGTPHDPFKVSLSITAILPFSASVHLHISDPQRAIHFMIVLYMFPFLRLPKSQCHHSPFKLFIALLPCKILSQISFSSYSPHSILTPKYVHQRLYLHICVFSFNIFPLTYALLVL